jgi:hypothetical protein
MTWINHCIRALLTVVCSTVVGAANTQPDVPGWLREAIKRSEEAAKSASGTMNCERTSEWTQAGVAKLPEESQRLLLGARRTTARSDWQVVGTTYKTIDHTWPDKRAGAGDEVLTTRQWDGKWWYFYEDILSAEIHGVGRLEANPNYDLLPSEFRHQYKLMPLSRAIAVLSLTDKGEEADPAGGRLRVLEGTDALEFDDEKRPIARRVVIKLSFEHGYTIRSTTVTTVRNGTTGVRCFETLACELVDGRWMPSRVRITDTSSKGEEVLRRIEIFAEIKTLSVGPGTEPIKLDLRQGREFIDGRGNFFLVGPHNELKPNKDRGGDGR